MSVLGSVIFADNQVGDFGSQIVFVNAAEVFDLFVYNVLREESEHMSTEEVQRLLTRYSGGILVQQTTTPLKGLDGSTVKCSSSSVNAMSP